VISVWTVLSVTLAVYKSTNNSILSSTVVLLENLQEFSTLIAQKFPENMLQVVTACIRERVISKENYRMLPTIISHCILQVSLII